MAVTGRETEGRSFLKGLYGSMFLNRGVESSTIDSTQEYRKYALSYEVNGVMEHCWQYGSADSYLRVSKYFSDHDKDLLGDFFGIKDFHTKNIVEILSEEQIDTRKQALARIMKLFIYGYVDAIKMVRYFDSYYASNKPPFWRLQEHTRFTKLEKFIQVFKVISMRNILIDNRDKFAKDTPVSMPEAAPSMLQSFDRKRAKRCHDSFVKKDKKVKTQLDSLLYVSSKAASDKIFRTVNDYLDYYVHRKSLGLDEELSSYIGCPDDVHMEAEDCISA